MLFIGVHHIFELVGMSGLGHKGFEGVLAHELEEVMVRTKIHHPRIIIFL